MDTLKSDDFIRQWTSVSKSCVEQMETYDRRTMRLFRTFEDIEKSAIEEPEEGVSARARQEIIMAKGRLADFNEFCEFCTTKLGPDLDTDAFWGLLGLLLTVALENDVTAERVIQMVKKLSGKSHLILMYSRESTVPTKEEKQTCFEILVLMTRFFSDSVEFLRKSGDMFKRDTPGHEHVSWQTLIDIFEHVKKDMDDALSELEKIATLRGNQETASWLSLLSMAPRSFRDVAQLPCFKLPPARNSRFFDRDDVIEKVEAHFDSQESGNLRSIALYGMGGVGKSHVALKYAEQKQLTKELDAVFWVEGQTAVLMDNSFTDIALRLKLPEAKQHTQIENRMIVKEWLQHTDCQWLIIYDNVESASTLQDYWPVSGSRGRVLITTRNHSLAQAPADIGIEVASWDTETGSKFLLHLLSGHISADLLANESKSAYDLSERLSGHALALSNMCGMIHRRSYTISELLEVYDRSHNIKDALDTVWRLSFQNLKRDSAALLSFFSFCAPDSIPQEVLDLNQAARVTESLLWYKDEDRLSDAIEDLLVLALIKRDRTSKTFSIHRLIQEHYLRFLTTEDRQQAFCDAAVMLFNVFPKKATTLYDSWAQCRRWLPHVLNLRDSFRRERHRDLNFHSCMEACLTWTSCQRFLLERNDWSELDDLITINKIAIGTLPAQDSDLWMLSATESHIGQMYSRQGRYRLARGSLLTTCDIKLSASEVDYKTLTWAQDNVAANFNSMMELDATLEWHAHSQASWKQYSEQNGLEFRLPPIIRQSHGRSLSYMKKFDEAREEMTMAFHELMAERPLNWGLAAGCKFGLGRLQMFERRYEAAEGSFMEAQNLWLQGDESRVSEFNGSIMYRIGCCALLQGNVDAALKHVQDARVVTSLRKDVMPGEHARCLYKLSEILSQFPDREKEADELYNEAKELYWKIQARLDESPGTEILESLGPNRDLKEEDFDSLVFIHWR